MLLVAENGKRVTIYREFKLPKVEKFPAVTLESNFELNFGIDLKTPAGREVFKSFKKKFLGKVTAAADKQDQRVKSVHSSVASILKETSQKPKDTLENEITNEVATWYNFSKNGLPREANSALASAAKEVEKKYKDQITAKKVSILDPKLSDNRKDVLKNLMGAFAALAKLYTTGPSVKDFASLSSSTLKFFKKSNELNDKLYKPTTLNLAKLADMTKKSASAVSDIEHHLDLIENLRRATRAGIAGHLAEAQQLHVLISKANKATEKGDAAAGKSAQKMAKQLQVTYKKATELDKSLVETADLVKLVNQAHKLLEHAAKLALQRAKASRDTAKKASDMANDASILADIVKSVA